MFVRSLLGVAYLFQLPSALGGDVLSLLSLETVDPQAKCTDGSPAAYYFKPGNTSTWIVDFQGGGWCYSADSCDTRCNESFDLCSSTKWTSNVTESGLFHPSIDRVLAGATKVWIQYCTSDAHMADGSAFGYEFRGDRVFRAVFKDLVEKHGLGSGNQRHLLILGGQSAGSRGAMVHLDYVSDVLGDAARNIEVRGFLDSPLWIDLPTFPGGNAVNFATQASNLFAYGNIKNLGEECMAAFPKSEHWKCMFGEYRMPHIKTPYFLVASQFDSFQLSKAIGHDPATDAERTYASIFAYRTALLVHSLRESFRPVNGVSNAVFSWACYNHATSMTHEGYNTLRIGDMTMDKAMKHYLFSEGNSTSFEWVEHCDGFACGAGCQKADSSLLVI